MQQDGDMRGRQFEHRRHVFAADLVEHPERHDRTLHLSEVIEAPDHERVLLRLRDQLVDRLGIGREKGEGFIARIVWARDLVRRRRFRAWFRTRTESSLIESSFDSTSRRACGSTRNVWNAS